VSDAPRQRTVVDGVLQYTSASAIQRLAFGCETSYYYRYVEGLPDPAGKAAELGGQIHARIEKYLKLGVDVLGKYERTALDADLIPPPGGPGPYPNVNPNDPDGPPLMLDIMAEGKVDGTLEAFGVPFKGGIDLLDPRGEVPVLIDWKTKGDIREVAAYLSEGGMAWANKGVDGAALEAALIDPTTEYGLQMVTYGEAVRRRFPHWTHVVFQHVYIQTRGSLVGVTWTPPVPLAEISKRWDKVSAWIVPMRRVAAASGPEATTPNIGHCFKWKKACTFSKVCPHFGKPASTDLADILGLNDGGNTMGLLDQLKKNATTAAVEPKSAQPAPAPEAPPVEQAQTVSPVQVGTEYVLSDASSAILETVTGGIGRFKFADGTLRDVALSTVVKPIVRTATPVPVAAEQTSTQPEVEVAPVEAPKKRGRPPGSKNKAVEAAPAITADDYVAVAETGKLPAGTGVHLYIGCAPTGVRTTTLHGYLEEVEKAILNEIGETLPDLRLSGHEICSFGKWRATLAQTVIKSPPPPGHYVVPGIPGEKLQVVVDALAGVLASQPGALVIR
jgi:hypothetical protein